MTPVCCPSPAPLRDSPLSVRCYRMLYVSYHYLLEQFSVAPAPLPPFSPHVRSEASQFGRFPCTPDPFAVVPPHEGALHAVSRR